MTYYIRILSKVLTVLFLGYIQFGQAQTTIFNHSGSGSLPAGWSGSNTAGSQAIEKGSYYLVEAGGTPDLVTTASFDLCAYASATFSVDIGSYGSGTHRALKVEVSTDGGATFSQSFTTNTTSSSTETTISPLISITTLSDDVVLRFSVDATSGRGIRMQNLVLEGNGSGSCGGTSYTVTFDGNGNDGGSMSAQTASSTTALTTNTFTKSGYTFSGWNTQANGSGTAYADGVDYAFNANITLYAQWTLDGGSGGSETTICYDFSSGGASTSDNLDANIQFTTHRNSGTSNPGIFSGQLRLYQNGTKGGSIKIDPLNGVTITEVVINASDRTGDAGYTVDGGSSTNLSGGSTYTIDNINATDEVEFYQREDGSSNRIYVDEFCVTYTEAATCTEPSSQASNANTSNVTANTTRLSWTRGNGTGGVLVLAKEGSAVDAAPVSGTSYNANSAFGSGDEIGTGNYVIYSGTGTQVDISNLTANTTYHYAIYEFNSNETCYNTSDAAASTSQLTSCGNTPDAVSNFVASAGNEQVSLTWTNPLNCFDEILVIAEDGTIGFTPTGDGSSYNADSTYQSGTCVSCTGSNNEYVVYKGSGESVTVTGLTNGTDYCFKIWTRYGSNWSSSEVNCNVTPKLEIPDNDCGGNDASLMVPYSGGTSITDINVTVEIEHTYRADLIIEIESPNGTIVRLMDGDDGGSGDNLHVTFDDEAANSSMESTDHGLGGSVDFDCQPVAGDYLSLFDGESPNGNWTLRVCDDAAADVGYLISFSIDITNSCVPTHSVSDYFPKSGPEYTMVKIIGSGFTESTTVYFEGIESDSTTLIDENTLYAEVPAGASYGDLQVEEGTCPLTVGTFNLTNQVEKCFSSNLNGDTPNDIIMTEVYDANSGSLSYIEVFNGTGSPINLSGYEVRRYTSASGGSATHTYTFPDTTLKADEELVGGISTNLSNCSFCDFIFSTPQGINEDDRLDLYNGTTHIDRWYDDAQGNTGYSYIRTGITNTPTYPTAHVPGDWNSTGSESSDDLGVVGDAIDPPTIDIQPIDVNACSIIMSITASPANGGTLSYQWMFNDGESDGWADIDNSSFPGLTVSGENTRTLSITGSDLEDYNNYQFYCQVIEDGACGYVSNAAQFNAQSERYFKSSSMGTGNWTSPNSWLMATESDFNNNIWEEACSYPDNENSDYIHIINGDIVTLNEELSVDQLTIEFGGTLILEENTEIGLNDGSVGADLVIEGTLIDNGNSANGFNWEETESTHATWQFGTNGTLIKTNTSSVEKYRTHYEDTDGNPETNAEITATANWVYRYVGNTVTVSSVDMFYPNLTFESNSGAHDFSGLGSLRGSLGYCTVKGNMNVGGSGTGTVTVRQANTNETGMTVLGNLSIQSNSSLILEGSDELGGESTDFVLHGDFENNGLLDLGDDAGFIQTATSLNNTGSGTVNIIRKQADDNSGGNVLNYWSSPIEGNQLGAGYGATGSRHYRYPGGEDDNADFIEVSSGTVMQQAIGYPVFGELEANFNGATTDLNNGDITLNLWDLAEKDGDEDEYWSYLIGNPYPSAISAADFITHNVKDDVLGTPRGILGTIYVFSQANAWGNYDRQADNIAINALGSQNGSDPEVNGPNYFDSDEFKIASGQAFWVIRNGTSDNATSCLSDYCDVEFTNDMRVEGNDNFKSLKSGLEIYNRFWLTINSDKNIQSTLLGFANLATMGEDKLFDSPIIPSENELRIWTSIKGKDYLIQGLPRVENVTARIPVGISVPGPGEYQIKMSSTSGWPKDKPVYFYDAKRQRYYNLQEESFVYQSNQKEIINDRFYLQFKGKGKPVSTSINELDYMISLISATNETIQFQAKNNFKRISVSNVLGQEIDTEVNLTKNQAIELKKARGLNIIVLETQSGIQYQFKLQ